MKHKYKVGDRLTWIDSSDRGISFTITKIGTTFIYFLQDDGITTANSYWILDDMAIPEHIYKSPLMKALS